MEEKSLYRLVNPKFTLEFMGKSYEMRKATLDKAIQYQKRLMEILKEQGAGLKIASYCIYLMLKDLEPSITEEIVLQNTPADIDVNECLVMLGFVNQSKSVITKKMEEKLESLLTTENSSLLSPKKQDGLQMK